MIRRSSPHDVAACPPSPLVAASVAAVSSFSSPAPAPSAAFVPAPGAPRLGARAQGLVSVIRGIGGPLQLAVAVVASRLRLAGQSISAADEARAYAQLVQQTVVHGRAVTQALGLGQDSVARWNGEPMRWLVLEALSGLACAQYKAAGKLQPNPLFGQTMAALTQVALEGARREDFMPGHGAATQARPVLDLLKAMPCALEAVTRSAFGRNPLVLATEVAWELQYKAVECTRRVLPAGATLDEWQGVYASFLLSCAQLYAQAHEAEAARLACGQLPAAGNPYEPYELPMNGVWDVFDHKVDQLTSFAGYMAADVPAAPALPAAPSEAA